MILRRRSFVIKRMPGFTLLALACFFALYMPLAPLVVYSFNEGNNIALWEGFSLRWYQAAWENQLVQSAAIRSIVVATIASIIATVLATMVALATTRTRPYRGQTIIYAMVNQPLVVPEIVTAVALLILFALIKQATNYHGYAYLVIAHSAFCIPFAYLPIRARLEGMDRVLETAAADLYATPWRAFKRITLPLMLPGVFAGAMLAFVISLDDVVITEFVKSAGQDTLPTYMLGQLRRSITPEINAISTVLLGISVLMVTLIFFLSRKKTA
ncbi:ABC transporter permease [Arenicellales bacterium nBUS_48]|jgi:spermidine/putrescine transport system permease protein|nr:ABC transporter permease [Pseudomonadota bacterium]